MSTSNKSSETIIRIAQQFVTILRTVPNSDDELLAASLALFINAFAEAAGPRFKIPCNIACTLLAAEFRGLPDPADPNWKDN